jgi:histidine triad (HIT) family protein
MSTIFTKIIQAEIPSYKIAENDEFYAFLDINPLAKGHCLVVPKLEEDYIFDLKDDMLSGLMVFSKKIALAIQKSIACKRIGIAVLGLEVAHAHIHLVPLNGEGDMNFSNEKLKLSEDEFVEIMNSIKKNI